MIFGAPVGTLTCFVVVSLLNMLVIKRKVNHPPAFGIVFLKPLVASALMAAAAWGSHGLIDRFLRSLDLFWKVREGTGVLYYSFVGSALATVGAIFVAVVVYAVLILVLRVISRDDLALMPKGEKIAKVLRIK